MDPPSLWFSDEDVSNFIYQHDAMLGPCSNLVRREWIAKKRPTVIPELRYSVRGIFSIPSAIIEVIRASARDFQEPAERKA